MGFGYLLIVPLTFGNIYCFIGGLSKTSVLVGSIFGIMSMPFSIIKEGSIELLPTFYSIIFFLQIQILVS